MKSESRLLSIIIYSRICYYLIANNSQSSEDVPSPDKEESINSKLSITVSQLVNNFSNIFKGIAKREGLSDPCTISIGMNQIKTLLDEFGKAR